MIERTIDIPTRDGKTTTFVVHPERRGPHPVIFVIGFAVLLQLVESNVLIPRIMNRTVGVSALVGLLAILAFGTLYGILGVLIAIPMTAVIQVLLDTMVVNAEPIAQSGGLVGSPWADLRARVWALRQQARVRLRALRV